MATAGTAPQYSDAEVAAAAEKFVADNFGGEAQLRVLSWAVYIYEYSRNGILNVRVQVDRNSPEGQEVGEHVAQTISGTSTSSPSSSTTGHPRGYSTRPTKCNYDQIAATAANQSSQD